MEITQVDILEQKLNRAVKIGIYIHCVGVFALAFLACFEPVSYKKIGMVISILAFVSSVANSKPYFEAKQQLEKSRMARPKSAGRKFNEYFLIFILPYSCWLPMIAVFLR
jgi:hypothetical protein